MCTNVRAAFSKLESIATEILEENLDISFLTEIWLNENNSLHANQLDRMFEMKGLETTSI